MTISSHLVPSQASETSTGAEVADAYAAGVPDVEDEDPSDLLRRVQAGMSAAKLSEPLDEQIEVVGEQFYLKKSASCSVSAACRSRRRAAHSNPRSVSGAGAVESA